MTCQVPDAKKSWIPLKVLAITGEFFRSGTQRETRARRSPPERTPRTQKRSACRQRSPSYALILGEVFEDVQGARDEDRLGQGPGLGERLDRILDRLNLAEVGAGPFRQVGRRQRPVVARGGGDQTVTESREGR